MEPQTSLSSVDLDLAESHHRIKNDLQLLASWAARAARSADDPRAALESIAGKILTIGRLHQTAQRTGGEIALDEALHALADDLETIAGARACKIEVTVLADRDWVDASEGRSVLLIAHELAVNALKHGFGPEGGQLRLRYRRMQGARSLVISNEVAGCTPSTAIGVDAVSGLGSDIVQRLAKQLGAAVLRQRTLRGYTVEVVWLDRPLRFDADQSQGVGAGRHLTDRQRFESHLAA